MKVSIEKGQMTITIPVDDPPQPSASGKTLVLCSTRGNIATDCQFKGKNVVVGLTAYVKPEKKKE